MTLIEFQSVANGTIILPIIAAINEKRFAGKQYGSIFGVVMFGISVGGLIGTWGSPHLANCFGFPVLCYTISAVLLLSSGLSVFYRNF